MADISKNIVKGSKKMAKNSQKYAKKLLKQSEGVANDLSKNGQKTINSISKEGTNVINNTIKNSQELGNKIAKRSKKLAKSLRKGDINKSIKNTGHLVKDTLDGVKTSFDKGLENTLANKTISLTLKVVIAIYAAFIAQHISKGFAFFLDNIIVKILMALIIVLIANKDAALAILIALAYVLSLQTANKYRMVEKTNNIDPPFPNENFQSDSATEDTNSTTNSNSIKPANAYNLDGPAQQGSSSIEGSLAMEGNVSENEQEIGNEQASELLPEQHEQHIQHVQHEQHKQIKETSSTPEPNSEWETSLTKHCQHLQTKDLTNELVPGALQASCVKTHKNQSCSQGEVEAPRPYSGGKIYSNI